MRGFVPLMLIGLGIYILRGYIFKPKTTTAMVRFRRRRIRPILLRHSVSHGIGAVSLIIEVRPGSVAGEVSRQFRKGV